MMQEPAANVEIVQAVEPVQQYPAIQGSGSNIPIVADMQDRERNGSNCMVVGCSKDLENEQIYYRRQSICKEHLRASCLFMNNQYVRFCQQCARFHSIYEFDGNKKSCKERLESHNMRRKPSMLTLRPTGNRQASQNYSQTTSQHAPLLASTSSKSGQTSKQRARRSSFSSKSTDADGTRRPSAKRAKNNTDLTQHLVLDQHLRLSFTDSDHKSLINGGTTSATKTVVSDVSQSAGASSAPVIKPYPLPKSVAATENPPQLVLASTADHSSAPQSVKIKCDPIQIFIQQQPNLSGQSPKEMSSLLHQVVSKNQTQPQPSTTRSTATNHLPNLPPPTLSLSQVTGDAAKQPGDTPMPFTSYQSTSNPVPLAQATIEGGPATPKTSVSQTPLSNNTFTIPLPPQSVNDVISSLQNGPSNITQSDSAFTDKDAQHSLNTAEQAAALLHQFSSKTLMHANTSITREPEGAPKGQDVCRVPSAPPRYDEDLAANLGRSHGIRPLEFSESNADASNVHALWSTLRKAGAGGGGDEAGIGLAQLLRQTERQQGAAGDTSQQLVFGQQSTSAEVIGALATPGTELDKPYLKSRSAQQSQYEHLFVPQQSSAGRNQGNLGAASAPSGGSAQDPVSDLLRQSIEGKLVVAVRDAVGEVFGCAPTGGQGIDGVNLGMVVKALATAQGAEKEQKDMMKDCSSTLLECTEALGFLASRLPWDGKEQMKRLLDLTLFKVSEVKDTLNKVAAEGKGEGA